MSEFNEYLERARVRQRRLYLVLMISVVAVFLVLFVMFSVMKVTTVEVLPAEASAIASIDLLTGAGFVVGKKVYTFTSGSSLSVAASGFRSAVVEMLPDKSGFLRVELTELPGRLRVVTRPPGETVRWLLDGKLLNISEVLETELMPGDYSLEIDSPYHEKKTIDIHLIRGEHKNLAIDLQPVQGEIEVLSIPEGMPVKIDGVTKGVTPINGQYIGGRYNIEIESADFEMIVDQVEVTNSAPKVLRNYRLQPKKAYLDIDLAPAGGDLLINGLKVEQVFPLAVDSTLPNTISYFRDGYFSESRTLTLAPGEKKRIAFNLGAEKGKVVINSSPSADVAVNGKPKGKTPLTLSLLAVKQNITLSQKGYRAVSRSVMPSSKKTTQVNVTLLDEQQAKLAEAKPRYKNTVGIELQLFTPSEFSMGAARHEKGQRANEFERDIVLTKPFYVGVREVTIEQYSRFRKPPVTPSPGNLPVTSVSWIEAAEYCNWLSGREKLSKFYEIKNGKLLGVNRTSNGYRLPSEAEWEWLARKAGRKSRTQFTWGNELVIPPATGNIADEAAKSSVSVYVPGYNDGYAQLAPVASFKPDKAGLYDMTGNASEWVHDYYSLVPPAEKTRETDPLGDEHGSNHVIKGSNWRSGTLTELRASFREGAISGRDDTGFRVARYLHGEQ
jgi:formylglycine-generating enzyme required for sulfatase activity